MNAKKAKALRKKMREVFGDEVLSGERDYSLKGGGFRNVNMSGRRLYQDSKRIVKTGGRGALQDPGDSAD